MVLLPRHDRASVEGVTLKDRERLFSTAVDVTLGISQASSPGDHDRAARCPLFRMRRFLCVIFGIDPVLSVGGLTSRCKIVAAAPTSRQSCKLGRASIFEIDPVLSVGGLTSLLLLDIVFKLPVVFYPIDEQSRCSS